MNPKVRLRVRYQQSWFLSILTCFVLYYSRFWGPKANSMVVEPQGALTCRSSTITVFVDSGPFHGLLLNPGVRLRVGLQHSQFWPILSRFMDYYSLFWGPGVISMINEPRGALTCRLSTLAVFVDSDPFCGILLTVLGSESDFHSC